MDDESDSPSIDTLSEYLDKKGTIALYCKIKPTGSQFTELLGEVPISRRILEDRLENGMEMGLLEKESVKRPGTSHIYVLTERGARFRVLLNQWGLTEKYHLLKSLQQSFDEQSERFQTWFEKDESRLEEPLKVENTREFLREYSDIVGEQRE